MPDHLHLLAGGAGARTACLAFMKDFKQRSGHAFKRRTGRGLWQPSFHDRVLRDAEATPHVVRYILANPVRAGLVANAVEYPFSGSSVYRLEDLWQM